MEICVFAGGCVKESLVGEFSLSVIWIEEDIKGMHVGDYALLKFHDRSVVVKLWRWNEKSSLEVIKCTKVCSKHPLVYLSTTALKALGCDIGEIVSIIRLGNQFDAAERIELEFVKETHQVFLSGKGDELIGNVMKNQMALLLQGTVVVQNCILPFVLRNRIELMRVISVNDPCIISPHTKLNWKESTTTSNMPNDNEWKENISQEMGGFEGVISHLQAAFHSRKDSLRDHHGALLTGGSGCGKTTLAKLFAHHSTLPFLYIHCSTIVKSDVDETFKTIQRIFNSTASIIILDEIDILTPRQDEDEVSREERVAFYHLLEAMDFSNAFVIGITSETPPNLLTEHTRLSKIITMETNTPIQRFAMLQTLLKYSKINESVLRELSLVTHGYILSDLIALITETLRRTNLIPSLTEFKQTMQTIRPSILRPYLSPIHLCPIYAMDDILTKLDNYFNPPTHSTFPRGILFSGPPGSGKTLLASHLSTFTHFLTLPPTVRSKFVGQSTLLITQTFSTARACSPCIVFIDQMDVMCCRNSKLVGVIAREIEKGGVVLVGCSRRPEELDEEIVGLVDVRVELEELGVKGRVELMKGFLSKVPMEVGEEEMVEASKRLMGSAAVVKNVCHEAAYRALRRSVDECIDGIVEREDIEWAINKVVGS